MRFATIAVLGFLCLVLSCSKKDETAAAAHGSKGDVSPGGVQMQPNASGAADGKALIQVEENSASKGVPVTLLKAPPSKLPKSRPNGVGSVAKTNEAPLQESQPAPPVAQDSADIVMHNGIQTPASRAQARKMALQEMLQERNESKQAGK